VTYSSKLDFRPPRRAMTLGMWFFLASLSMLFLSSMFGYILIRTHLAGSARSAPIVLPRALWGSTAILLLGSLTIHRAIANIRVERIPKFHFYLYSTFFLALVFLAVQIPCLWEILRVHNQEKLVGVGLYGLVFCLIVLHALHVVGGIGAMSFVTYKTLKGRYDHENFMGIRHAALYWHFLDVVWIFMFTIFLITG
jgi:cytochrome c oxidase subunit 3